MTGALMRQLPGENRHTRRRPDEDEGRDHRDSAASQGMPTTATHFRSYKEARKNASLQPSEGAWPCWRLDFQLLVSKTGRQPISAVLSPPVDDALLHLPQGTAEAVWTSADSVWRDPLETTSHTLALKGLTIPPEETHLNTSNLGFPQALWWLLRFDDL